MKILDRLPISGERTSLRFGTRHVTIHTNQTIVWMSVTLSGTLKPEASAPRFPALLDTGSNFGFAMQDRQLRDWAGIDTGYLDVLGSAEINGQPATQRDAIIWLYPNAVGCNDVALARPPLPLTLSKGLAVYSPDARSVPRLPLLGLPALLENGLDLWLDPDRRCITVRTRTWLRLFDVTHLSTMIPGSGHGDIPIAGS